MRKIKIVPGEYYHVFNRGMRKQIIFHDDNDRKRFLFALLHFQSPMIFPKMSRSVKEFGQYSVLDNNQNDIKKIIKDRFVELVAFCMMPNHFHLILKEVEEGGISKYTQRVLEAYSKYYNTKYQRSGHLFQGPYGAVWVEDDRQLMHLSAYIHKNHNELGEWRNSKENYPWSSYEDYVGENRWGDLLDRSIILDRFKNKNEYRFFVKSSPAKELKEEFE